MQLIVPSTDNREQINRTTLNASRTQRKTNAKKLVIAKTDRKLQ